MRRQGIGTQIIDYIKKNYGERIDYNPWDKGIPFFNAIESKLSTPTGESKTIKLIHYSNQNKKSFLINPKHMGTGQGGAEMERQLAGAPKTSAYYIEGTEYPKTHEANWRFPGNPKYTAEVPRNKLYDWNADPLKFNERLDSTAAEHAMKRKGYWGYISGNPPQVRLFKAVKGTRVPG